MNIKVNYVGLTRRTLSEILDQIVFFFPLLILSISLLGNDEIHDDFLDEAKQLTSPYIIFTSVLYTVLEILMITRLSGTPGQLLCCIRIKDVNTLENITLVQATTRCVLSKVPILSILGYILIIVIIDGYISEWWLLLLSKLVFIAIAIATILILMLAILDQCKQFFYDKIAKTVAIDYKPS